MLIDDGKIIEVLNREVKKIGDGAHITVPKKHLGKKCFVVVIESRFFR